MKEDNGRVYNLPNNFIESGRWLNGMLRVRFTIEAVILFLIIFFPAWTFIPNEGSSKLGLCLLLSLPPSIIALVGINEDSLIQTLVAAKSWFKARQIMLYKDDTQTYSARPVDVMLNETNATDVIITAYTDWSNKRAQQKAMIELVEGVDFEFMPDDEYERMIPKERRKEMRRQAKEEAKRRKDEARLLKRKGKASEEAPKELAAPASEGESDIPEAPITDESSTVDTPSVDQTAANGQQDQAGEPQADGQPATPDAHLAPSEASSDGNTPEDVGPQTIAFETEEAPIDVSNNNDEGEPTVSGMELFVVETDEEDEEDHGGSEEPEDSEDPDDQEDHADVETTSTITDETHTSKAPQGTKRKRSRSRRRKRPPQG